MGEDKVRQAASPELASLRAEVEGYLRAVLVDEPHNAAHEMDESDVPRMDALYECYAHDLRLQNAKADTKAGGWKRLDATRDTQLTWGSPGDDGDNDLIGICPYRGQLMLTRDEARELAGVLLRFADEPPSERPKLRLVSASETDGATDSARAPEGDEHG